MGHIPKNGQSFDLRVPDDYQYTVSETIGEGTYGEVLGATRSDGKKVALKFVDKKRIKFWTEVDGKELPSEIALLKRTSGHRNIVGLHDFEITAEKVVMVLERPSPVLDGFDYLARPRLQKSTEKVAKLVIRQMINAVMHCLSVGVSHGDIKEENLLLELNTGRVVLIDFGLAEEIKHGRVNTLLGTLEYNPPEAFTAGVTSFDPESVAIWSIGILAYRFVTGYFPFETMIRIRRENVKFPRGLSRNVKDLIFDMLRKKPEKRPRLERCLTHRWFDDAESEINLSDELVSLDQQTSEED